ncbi:hypothetical protein ACF09J_34715 [Streptomyces sp. NPDC014889]|uniref:hypothetical protein n=1 Tax=Streptomyces sp. NPDC014889 TaxID=3364928 RepID=UPI0036FB2A20
MTGPGDPHELWPLARAGTAAQRRITGGGCGAESPDDPAEWAFATHKSCPIDGCPGPARVRAPQLVLPDRRHPYLVASPLRPGGITLAPRRRLYVRQEYAAWTAAGRPRI